jgi:hypothetical protein
VEIILEVGKRVNKSNIASRYKISALTGSVFIKNRKERIEQKADRDATGEKIELLLVTMKASSFRGEESGKREQDIM